MTNMVGDAEEEEGPADAPPEEHPEMPHHHQDITSTFADLLPGGPYHLYVDGFTRVATFYLYILILRGSLLLAML